MLRPESARIVDRACEIVAAFTGCYLASALAISAVILPFQLWAAVHTTGPIVLGFASWWPPVIPAILLLWCVAHRIAASTKESA